MTPSPLRWAGGKSRLRKHIIPLMPPHHTYCEPFAGAAWTLMGKPQSPLEILNDLDPEVVNFFTVLRDQPREFIRSFYLELVSRAEFHRLADTDPGSLNAVDRAHRFYYLVMAGWGGEYLYPRFQTAIRDAGHGNRLVNALLHLEEKIIPAHRRLRGVTIENQDWLACLQSHDGPDTLFYVDPPYAGNGVNYRYNMRDDESHDRLADALQRCQGLWIASGYDNPSTRRRFQNHWIVPLTASAGMPDGRRGRSTNLEVLATNFDPNRLLPETRLTPSLTG